MIAQSPCARTQARWSSIIVAAPAPAAGILRRGGSATVAADRAGGRRPERGARPRAARTFFAAARGRTKTWLIPSWWPSHFGYALKPEVAPPRRGDGERGAALPSFVPAAYVPALASAAQRFNVSAALLAAQIYVESGFNPFAVSAAGAQGIAQFMPATARAVGLRNPFDAQAAIAAQARLMRDLLRRFGTVPLALAAYNAGPAAVARCVCIPPIPETRGYVARILGLLGGAGEVLGGGLEVGLVR